MRLRIRFSLVTIGNRLQRRMLIVNQCCMCLRDEESVAQLFVDCPVTEELLECNSCFVGHVTGLPYDGDGAY